MLAHARDITGENNTMLNSANVGKAALWIHSWSYSSKLVQCTLWTQVNTWNDTVLMVHYNAVILGQEGVSDWGRWYSVVGLLVVIWSTEWIWDFLERLGVSVMGGILWVALPLLLHPTALWSVLTFWVSGSCHLSLLKTYLRQPLDHNFDFTL